MLLLLRRRLLVLPLLLLLRGRRGRQGRRRQQRDVVSRRCRHRRRAGLLGAKGAYMPAGCACVWCDVLVGGGCWSWCERFDGATGRREPRKRRAPAAPLLPLCPCARAARPIGIGRASLRSAGSRQTQLVTARRAIGRRSGPGRAQDDRRSLHGHKAGRFGRARAPLARSRRRTNARSYDRWRDPGAPSTPSVHHRPSLSLSPWPRLACGRRGRRGRSRNHRAHSMARGALPWDRHPGPGRSARRSQSKVRGAQRLGARCATGRAGVLACCLWWRLCSNAGGLGVLERVQTG